MKNWLLWIVSTLTVAAHAQSVTLSEFKEESFGYSGLASDEVGSQLGSRVLYIKLEKTVTPQSGQKYRVDLRYPKLTAQVLRQMALPQTGQRFACGLSSSSTGFKLIKVESFEKFFRDLSPDLDKVDQSILDFDKPAGEDRICSVIVEPSSSGVQPGSIATAVSSGLPRLKIRRRTLVEKSFADLTPRYVEFLDSDAVTFQTDDEFWFLVAASVHQEPQLLQGFTASGSGYVENWVRNFAFNVVARVKNQEYRKALLKLTGRVEHVDSTYTIRSDAKEVEYEM